MSFDPQELQDLLDELEKSRASRRRAWENPTLQGSDYAHAAQELSKAIERAERLIQKLTGGLPIGDQSGDSLLVLLRDRPL
jgi:hypothetical protein